MNILFTVMSHLLGFFLLLDRRVSGGIKVDILGDVLHSCLVVSTLVRLGHGRLRQLLRTGVISVGVGIASLGHNASKHDI